LSDGLRVRRVVAAVVAGIVLLAVAFAVGRVTAPRVDTPGNLSAEAGFARDMQVHHQQAVAMAMTIRDETTDPDIRRLAYDIALGQSQGAGQLYGYLVDWNLPQASPEPAMTWMSLPPLAGANESHQHEHAATTPAGIVPGGAMPGYATDAQLAKLGGLTGIPAERYFLTLMIAHHKGGIEMAQSVLQRSSYAPITAFARNLVAVQQTEITTMRAMLAERAAN
jgi:uncharacterized protein (DUF305 family)